MASVSFISDFEKEMNDMLNNLNIVVFVLIVSAGLLAFVVLYNLNNINIAERKAELATLKVLGFYDLEYRGLCLPGKYPAHCHRHSRGSGFGHPPPPICDFNCGGRSDHVWKTDPAGQLSIQCSAHHRVCGAD